jgi:hypothetical protein
MSAPKGKRPKRIEAWAVIESKEIVSVEWTERRAKTMAALYSTDGKYRIVHWVEAPKRKRGKG